MLMYLCTLAGCIGNIIEHITHYYMDMPDLHQVDHV